MIAANIRALLSLHLQPSISAGRSIFSSGTTPLLTFAGTVRLFHTLRPIIVLMAGKAQSNHDVVPRFEALAPCPGDVLSRSFLV